MATTFDLETTRMRLQRLTASHLDDLVELDSDPLVMRFITKGVPSTREDYLGGMLQRIAAFDDTRYGFAAAYHEDKFIGWFHLRPSVADASVLELGYRLRRAVWGRGLATEGSMELLRYAFDELGRDCVDACADPENAASIRVMVKCGMTAAGRFQHPHAPLEVVRYLVTRDDFARLNPEG